MKRKSSTQVCAKRSGFDQTLHQGSEELGRKLNFFFRQEEEGRRRGGEAHLLHWSESSELKVGLIALGI